MVQDIGRKLSHATNSRHELIRFRSEEVGWGVVERVVVIRRNGRGIVVPRH